MSARTMTTIREEEVQKILPAIASTSTYEEEAGVDINMAANSTTSVSSEEVKASSSASTIVPVRGKEELNSEMVVIGYFLQVPSVKWHPKLEMMSKAGVTQRQYEQKVLVQGYVDCFCLSATVPLIDISSQLRVELVMSTR